MNTEEESNTKEGSNERDNLFSYIEDQGGIDRVFPPLDGTAFYSLICKINHSCDPNVIAKYVMTTTGLQAQLTSLKDIQPQEEFVQSYVDNTLGLFVSYAMIFYNK